MNEREEAIERLKAMNVAIVGVEYIFFFVFHVYLLLVFTLGVV